MSRIKVLYVEDEPFLAKIVVESLESRDFSVHLVPDGAQALHAFDQLQPDICVLDVMLPHRDGFSIGSEIRERDPRMPILFLTAKSQTSDLVQGFASGGNDYLKKPFSMEELIVRIQNLLDLMRGKNAPAREETEFALGRYRFLPQKLELCFGESVRKLSHRETELLLVLARHRNLKIERKTILMDVWGDDSFFNSRNLDVYITKLREYFRGDPGVEIITLKGVGYRLVTG
ncbi:MAG: response regulator transcription factor [Saprospirales bacterium]|nr:response regulator transcription factor [Saprospirales bacterium]